MSSASLYNICIIGYTIALFTYSINLALRRSFWRRFATITVAFAFSLQTIGMVFRWIEAGHVEVEAVEKATGETLTGLARWIIFTQHPPWSNLYEIMVYMSWGIVLVFLICEVKWRIRFMGIFALLIALTAFGVASLTDGVIKPLVPALKSWWIMIHVISASTAYAAGTIGAIASLFYLVKAKNRISLTALASGMMALSVFLGLVLGRGFSLLTDATYRVKLLREMGDDYVVVGKIVEDQFVPYYVPSPGVGPSLLFAIGLCLLSAIIMYKARQKSDVPAGWVKYSYFVGLSAMIFVGIVMVINDLSLKNIIVDVETANSLMPKGPWQLALQSNTWDLGFLSIILVGQIFIGLVILFPSKIRGLLPDASKLDRIAYAHIMVSFSLVAVVLVTGALWAHYAWGRYWGWDPKETGALVIWLNYALYLHTRVTYGWAGSRSAVIAILGFFIILAGFLGVNLGWFANGLHSYGSA